MSDMISIAAHSGGANSHSLHFDVLVDLVTEIARHHADPAVVRDRACEALEQIEEARKVSAPPRLHVVSAFVPNGVSRVMAVTADDSRLIDLCDTYNRAWDAYNGKAPWTGADGAPVSMTPDELEALVEEIEGELEGLQATTLEGLAAKARVAAHQAKQPDGRMDFSPSFTGDWPEQVLRDLLRMVGDPEL